MIAPDARLDIGGETVELAELLQFGLREFKRHAIEPRELGVG